MLEFQTGRDARMAVRIARRAASAAPIAATFATLGRAFFRARLSGDGGRSDGARKTR